MAQAGAEEDVTHTVASAGEELAGTVVLRNRASGLCLDSPTEGALPRDVRVTRCTDSSVQGWRVRRSPSDDSVVTFVNAATGFCLDSNDARDLYTFDCNGGDNQKWYLNEAGRTLEWLVNEGTGYCLDGAAASDCNGSESQRWSTAPRSGGTVRTAYSGSFGHGGNAFESERVDEVAGSCSRGFTRVSPPQITHEGHGGCTFDGWVNPFDEYDCRVLIRVHDDGGFLRGDCNWAVFEQSE